MPWVRIDENFAPHPKLVAAGPLAMALQVAALCYANKYLTDGFIPRAVAPTLINVSGLGVSIDDVIQSLIDHRLWEPADGGYQIHDYLDYQPSRAEVLAEREARKAAGRKGGKASAQARAQGRAQANASASAEADGQAKSKPVPVPVPEENVSQSESARAREEVAAAEEAAPVRGSRWLQPELRPALGEWRRHVHTGMPPEALATEVEEATAAGMTGELAAYLVGYVAERTRAPDPRTGKRVYTPAGYYRGIAGALLSADPPVTTVEQFLRRETEFQDWILGVRHDGSRGNQHTAAQSARPKRDYRSGLGKFLFAGQGAADGAGHDTG